jgi:hypothetical protein
VVVDEQEIDKCLEELTSAIHEATAASAPRRRPCADPWPLLLASIQDDVRLKNRLRRQWQITRDPALKTQINRLQKFVTYQLNVRRNDQWSDALDSSDSEDQSLWKMTKRSSHSVAPWQVPSGLAVSDSEKAEALADILEAQFQPVDDQSDPAFTEVADKAMRAYEYTPVSEPTLTTPSDVLQTSKALKAGKAPGLNGIPNRVLRHLTKRAITFRMKVFNAILRTQYFPPAWKHARVVPTVKPGKEPTLPSSFKPIRLLDTVGKLFLKILITRVLREVNERGLLRDEQFAFRPGHSKTLQLARVVERVNRN